MTAPAVAQGTAVGVPTARPRRWPSSAGKVVALSLGIVAVTLGIHFWFRSSGLPAGDRHFVPFWMLVPLFAATEGFAIHLRVRRGGHALSLSEMPMVLGVLGTDPVLLVVARVLGGGAGLALLRRQRGMKLGFNLALLGLQASVAVVVFRAVAGSVGSLGPREWFAAYVAMFVTDVLADVLITAAIAAHDDPGEWRRLRAAARGVPLVAVTTTIALVSALAVQYDRRAVALLVVVSVVAYLGYRAHVRQSQGHAQVEGLYAFTRALDGYQSVDDVARVVLGEARDQLRAEVAELILPATEGRRFVRMRLVGSGGVETTWIDGPPADAWWAPAQAGVPVLRPAKRDDRRGRPAAPADGMAVPVPIGDAEPAGVLLVADSLPDLPTFTGDQLRLFGALANHASVSLARARLVDQLRQEIAEKDYLALHDPLTGLPNRRQLYRLLDTALGVPAGAAGMTAVMLMDLDRFKEVNDALGHDVGDALLCEVGSRLQRRLGASGTVARLGGDEFAVLLHPVRSSEQAVAIGNDLARELERPVHVGHLTLNPRASIGIALAPGHGDTASALLQRADVAMYTAKETGNAVRVYRPQDDQNTAQRLELIADLREAIRLEEVAVMYQPKIDVRTGRITGAEALARWSHPQHGQVSPDVFIPLAEHAGLIRPLTLHVLKVALRNCQRWRRAGDDMHVAVNLSPYSLLDTALPDVVGQLLAETGMPASALTLELTESSILADPKASRSILERMDALGVKLAIDDFGTGYSSLGRLRELPIHSVKIDKSFVQRLGDDHRDRAVVRSAVQLGHALDLEVVAEGVEDAAIYHQLVREGCDTVQGYFVSRPLPAEDFVGWLAGRERSLEALRPSLAS